MKILNKIVIILLMIAGLTCLYIIYHTELSSTESLLLSLFLTIISVFCSWIISRYYAEHDFNKNLRMFALKASEKVNNLSNELDKLSIFLQHTPDTNEYVSIDQALLAKDLRIESAIHIISTLKSVNDGSLSDWQGVIGEELEAQKEEKEEREQDLRNLVDRIEALYSMNVNSYSNNKDEDKELENAKLQMKVDSLKNDINMLVTQISGYPTRKKKVEKVSSECPKCNSQVIFTNKQDTKTMKGITCPTCKARLYTSYLDGKPTIKIREDLSESIGCPLCNKINVVNLDVLPGSRLTQMCKNCNSDLDIVRSTTEVLVRIPKTVALPIHKNESLIKQVENLLPPQPWPKGIHKEIALKLGVTSNKVGRAITILIERGAFKNQVNGVVYTEAKENIP